MNIPVGGYDSNTIVKILNEKNIQTAKNILLLANEYPYIGVTTDKYYKLFNLVNDKEFTKNLKQPDSIWIKDKSNVYKQGGRSTRRKKRRSNKRKKNM
jgi:hypothetical protein